MDSAEVFDAEFQLLSLIHRSVLAHLILRRVLDEARARERGLGTSSDRMILTLSPSPYSLSVMFLESRNRDLSSICSARFESLDGSLLFRSMAKQLHQ